MEQGQKGYVISESDYRVFSRLLRDAAVGRLQTGPDLYRRRRPGGGGGASKRYATIVRSLQRADPTTDPATEEISCYKIKLSTSPDYSDWSATHGLYEAEDKVLWTDGLDYACLTDHTASEAKSPDNPSYWSCINPDAYVLGYPYNDLIATVPWLKVDSEFEVVQRSGVWYICATVLRCEEEGADGELYTSIQWNVDDWRAMAVFK